MVPREGNPADFDLDTCPRPRNAAGTPALGLLAGISVRSGKDTGETVNEHGRKGTRTEQEQSPAHHAQLD
jgi:hypothetical protein